MSALFVALNNQGEPATRPGKVEPNLTVRVRGIGTAGEARPAAAATRAFGVLLVREKPAFRQ